MTKLLRNLFMVKSLTEFIMLVKGIILTCLLWSTYAINSSMKLQIACSRCVVTNAMVIGAEGMPARGGSCSRWCVMDVPRAAQWARLPDLPSPSTCPSTFRIHIAVAVGFSEPHNTAHPYDIRENVPRYTALYRLRRIFCTAVVMRVKPGLWLALERGWIDDAFCSFFSLNKSTYSLIGSMLLSTNCQVWNCLVRLYLWFGFGQVACGWMRRWKLGVGGSRHISIMLLCTHTQ